MPADYRETAYAVPSIRPTVFSLELVLKVKITAIDRCVFDELVDSSSLQYGKHRYGKPQPSRGLDVNARC
jgi:hypothetical protein